MKHPFLFSLLAFCLSFFSGYAQETAPNDSLVSLPQAVDVSKFCCDSLDIMRIEFDFERAMEQYPSLERLDISMQHPKLSALPMELLQFRALTYLNLGFNHFSTVPARLAILRNLQCLDLSGNYTLQTLPDFLNTMPHLKVIRLHDMPHWSDQKKAELQAKFPDIVLEF
jgi:Leucine-rich repeat (LRR) protein